MDASVVEKLLHRIAEVKEALARRKDAAAKEAFEELRAAEGAFLEALAEKGMRFEKGKIIGANEDDENSVREDVDKSRKSRYNKRQYTPQDMDSITRESYNHHAWATNEIFGCLEPGEIGEFNSIISKINNGDYDPHKAYNGRLLIGVGRYKFGEKTTIILTDGNYESPSIDAVYKIITDKEETTKKVKEFIYARAAKVQNGRMGESFEAYGYNDDEPYFWEYYLENGADFEAFDRQRARRKENGGDNEASEAGENNIGRVKPIRRIHYDDKSGILTTYYKDGSKYVEYSSADKKVKKSRKTTAKPKDKLPTEAKLPEDPRTLELRGDQRKALANWSRNKVYTRKDAMEIVDGVIKVIGEIAAERDPSGERFHAAMVLKKIREKSIDQLFADLNTAATPTDREKAARKLADMIKKNAPSPRRSSLILSELKSRARAAQPPEP